MYKVIVVDDEFFSAKLLEKYITTYADGFEVVEIFRDGTDAVKYLADGGRADVIITDVRMRKMSGTQLAKYVYTMNLNIEVIFVSAYADFEYAKQAMEYNVFGYLLKVVDVDELVDMMQKLKKKLDSTKKVDLDDVELQRECFIENLLLGKYKSKDEMYSELKKCMYHGTERDLKCTVFKIEFNEISEFDDFIAYEGAEKVEASLVGIIKCALNKNYVSCIFYKLKIFYMQIIDDSDEFDIQYLENIISDIFAKSAKIEIIMSAGVEDYIEIEKGMFGFIEEKKNEDNANESDREKLMKTALNYINENIGNNLSRDYVAKIVGLTPAHFGRVFKEVNGINFSDYLYRQRMKCAEQLLKEGMRTVDVCAKIGVLDERQFRRSFKAYNGMTPAEYRKMVGRTEENKVD